MSTIPSSETTAVPTRRGSDANGHTTPAPGAASRTSPGPGPGQGDDNPHVPVLHSTPSHSKVSDANLKQTAYPVILEAEFGSSIKSRYEKLPSFRDLGPPDLVHISTVGSTSKHARESGQYHYINGLDVSSVDAPVAYLMSVMLNFEGKGSRRRDLKIGTVCVYNSFTRGELRIRAEFPGSISATFLFADDQRVALSGERVSEQIWLEAQVSSLIRSVLFNQDVSRVLPGMVKSNPLPTRRIAMEAIRRMCQLLHRGPSVGCRPEVLTPSHQNNYLNDALLKVVELTALHGHAVECIRAVSRADEFQLLITQILLMADDEVAAVQAMHAAVAAHPRDAFTLLEQSNYLVAKQRPDLALHVARRALDAAPTEFACWEHLVEVNLILENYREALSILNSAPMYSPHRRDAATVNARDEFVLNPPFEGCIESVWNGSSVVYGARTPMDCAPAAELAECDPVLVRLYNNSRLHGTFARAYRLVANLVRLVGWDRTLALRSKIFVMEDEMASQDFVSLKKKTLCERWLDHLFLVLYDDLRLVMIWENERIDNVVRHSALEWCLIGMAALRCHHFESGIAALKTTINSSFNYFASQELIQVYRESKTAKFKALHGKTIYNGDLITTKLVNDEYMIKLVVKHLSYDKRFFGEFNPDLIAMMTRFVVDEYDALYLKSLIAGEFAQSSRLFILTDRLVDWITMFHGSV